jgi:hypothetical protein
MAVISYREALNQAMREEMERDASVFIMGEEVGHYNGAYKVTQGLLQRFSERRIVDAPIAEMGFASRRWRRWRPRTRSASSARRWKSAGWNTPTAAYSSRRTAG